MKPESAFNAALARFKAIDADVAKLMVQLDEAQARRVEAAMASAAADTEVNTFATGTEFDPGKASTVVMLKQKSDAMLDLLDRGIEHLASELAAAKIELIGAEQECASAQAAFHDTALDEQAHKWLRSNAKQLQSLCQQLHLATIFEMTKEGGPCESYPPTHVEYIFTNVLPRLVSNEFSDDEAFREACQAELSGAAINRLQASQSVTSKERQTVKVAGASRERQIAALRNSWQPPVHVEKHLDRYAAEAAIANMRAAEDGLHSQLAKLEENMKNVGDRASSSNLMVALSVNRQKDEVKQLQLEIERVQRNRADLERQLQERAA